MKPLCVLMLFTSFVSGVAAQSPKVVQHTNWICFESTISAYSVPEHRLQFLSVVPSEGCRIAIPAEAGQSVGFDAHSFELRDNLEGVFGSVLNLEIIEMNRKNDGTPFVEFPHNGFYSKLIEEFNYSADSARARFCAAYPRAYVPLLDWHGLTEPKPCSDEAPRL